MVGEAAPCQRLPAFPVLNFLQAMISGHQALYLQYRRRPPHTGRPPGNDVAMAYEADMVIVWDQVSRGIAVVFRGKPHYLDGPFPDKKTAIHAAERYCFHLGWRDAIVK